MFAFACVKQHVSCDTQKGCFVHSSLKMTLTGYIFNFFFFCVSQIYIYIFLIFFLLNQINGNFHFESPQLVIKSWFRL